MLMRWSQLSPEGVYTSPPKAQLSYGTLIVGRVGIIRDASDCGKMALTIAVRYSAVRRQFPNPTGTHEEQILNYQTHQYRLMPLLANCYAYHFTSVIMNKQLEDVNEALASQNMSGLPGLHATSAGLKAFSTWWCNGGMCAILCIN
jgi:acyl-CoA oxidase